VDPTMAASFNDHVTTRRGGAGDARTASDASIRIHASWTAVGRRLRMADGQWVFVTARMIDLLPQARASPAIAHEAGHLLDDDSAHPRQPPRFVPTLTQRSGPTQSRRPLHQGGRRKRCHVLMLEKFCLAAAPSSCGPVYRRRITPFPRRNPRGAKFRSD